MSQPNATGSALLDGAEVLAELPGNTGVLLWKTLRAVRVSATGSDRERAVELFAPGARQERDREITMGAVASGLDRPLRRLTALQDPSESMEKQKVAEACGEVARWARESGEMATAAAFSEAASLARPEDAELAYEVVFDLVQKGDLTRAEEWCRRVVLLGRRSSSWKPYTQAVLKLGYIARVRGNFPLARRTLLRAVDLGARHGLPLTRGLALQVLFSMASDSKDVRAARGYADRAFRAYGACYPRLHFLSHDVHHLWLEQGQYARALPALRKIYPLFGERERLTIAGNLVRATAGVGDRREFRRAWSVAVSQLEWRQTLGLVSDAMLTLARGATGVGEWDLARTMAERARAVGEEKGEWRAVFSAESVLDCVRQRRSALAVAR